MAPASSQKTLETIQSELLALVRKESEFQAQHFNALWSLPLEERIAEGRCLAGLEFRRQEGTRYRFEFRKANHSDLREGDLIVLSHDTPKHPAAKGTIYRLEDEWVLLDFDNSRFDPSAELDTTPWTADANYLDLLNHYEKAILLLGQTERGRQRILPLLGGEREPTADLARTDEAGEAADRAGADESQSEAIALGVATDLCHLVQGPPGTGKTYVLAQIVRQRVARGERVVVSALTHRAIHNAINAIMEIAPEITDIAKIGREVYDPHLKAPYYETFEKSPLGQCQGGYVVGATPFALRGRPARGIDFDCLLMDEASQVTVPLAIMAMLSSETYLFVGDHRQLPPVFHSIPAEQSTKYSIFSHLEGAGFCTMLETTYRMNAELTAWPASQFYRGRLAAASANAGRRLAFPQPVRQYEALLDPAHPLVLAELEHEGNRRISREEATTVTGVLAALFEAGVSLSNVAVVVPFRRQAQAIRHFLRARLSIPADEINACVIDTVERMQGQQREVILVSMTASAPEYIARLLPFLLQPERLNVAVTRARSKTILFASRAITTIEVHDPASEELHSRWLNLRAQCHIIPL